MDFIFNKNDEQQELIEEMDRINKERAQKYREMFYKYSGIEPGTKLTKEDITHNWNNGFMRIRAIENCQDTELYEALLGDE